MIRFEKFSSFVDEYASCLSLGGMFLRTSDLRSVGESVEFEIALSDGFQLAEGIGEVVWRRTDSGDPTRPAGLGLRFTALDQQGRDLILKILEEQVRSGGEPFEVDAIPPDAETSSTPGEGPGDLEPDDSEEPTLITARPASPRATIETPTEERLQRHLDFDAPWGKALPDLPSEVLDDSGATVASPGRTTDVMDARSPEPEAGSGSPATATVSNESPEPFPETREAPYRAAEDAILELEEVAEREAPAAVETESPSFSAQLDAATAFAASRSGGALSEAPNLETAVEEIFSFPAELSDPAEVSEPAPETPETPSFEPPARAAAEEDPPAVAVVAERPAGGSGGPPEGESARIGPILDYEHEFESASQAGSQPDASTSRISVGRLAAGALVLALAAGGLFFWMRLQAPSIDTSPSGPPAAVEARPARDQPAPPTADGDAEAGGVPSEPAVETGTRPRAGFAAAPGEKDSQRAAPQPADRPATRIESITSRATPRGTLVVIDLDGDLPRDRILHDRLSWTPVKEQVSLLGIRLPYHPATVVVGTEELDRIRIGSHSGALGPEIRLVFDFRLAGVELRDLRATAGGLEVLVHNPSP